MAYNSSYTGPEIDSAIGAVKNKEKTWDSKQNKLNGTEDQIVGFNAAGDAVPVAPPDTGVTTFNGRTGAVTPQEGDYTADMVGARPDTWTPSAADVGAVPTSRTVNGKALSQDISLSASDVGARPDTWTPSAADVGALPAQTGTQGQLLGFTANNVVGAVAAPTADSLGAVPASRTVNGQALSQNITLDADDVNAASPPTFTTVTLTTSGWSSNTQTVTVSGVSADETAQLIMPVPALASQTAYYEAGILVTGQAANSLTFTCQNVPTEDLTVYVVMQEVGA